MEDGAKSLGSCRREGKVVGIIIFEDWAKSEGHLEDGAKSLVSHRREGKVVGIFFKFGPSQRVIWKTGPSH